LPPERKYRDRVREFPDVRTVTGRRSFWATGPLAPGRQQNALRSGGQGAVAGTCVSPYDLWVNKPPGKPTSVVKALINNRTVRRVVIKNAKQAITYVSTTLAARGAARSDDARSVPADAAGPAAKPVAKPASSTLDWAAITHFVSSVAKPVAEKMAGTQAGRSVLQTLNHISGEALGTTPKRSENSAAASITKLAGAAGNLAKTSDRTSVSNETKVRFTPLQPPAPPTEPIKTMKWPPRKPPAGAVEANQSGTDTAPE
jgi:hypothetical protein